MKYRVNILPDVEGTFIDITTDKITPEIERLIKFLESSSEVMELFVGTVGSQKFVVNKKEIIRFYAEDRKVFFQTANEKYITKFKLYELEEMLDGKEFIRISNSEIISLKEIKKLDFSFNGTIRLTTRSGIISYVSRSYLKNFKKVFNI